MKRNRGGERDLDHIIMAGLRGLDRASLEYPQVRARSDPDDGPQPSTSVRTRSSSRRRSATRHAASVRDRHRGPSAGQGAYAYRDLAPLARRARVAGLGITIHVGEEGGEYGVARSAR